MNIAQNPNSELSHFAVNTPQVFEIPETFREDGKAVSGSDDAVQLRDSRV